MSSPGYLDRRGPAVVAALLAGYAAVALAGVRHTSPTFDEPAFVVGGCAYWVHNDYRLNPESGNLPQRWAALPLVLSGDVRLPPADDPAWPRSDLWTMGERFFYDLGNPTDRMLFAARAAALAFGLGVGMQVYFWGRYLWGAAGGRLALAAFALSPAMLAHGPLANSDMCGACFLLAAVTAVWAVLRRVTARRLALCTLALGGLFLTKSSAALIVAVAGVLVGLRVAAGPPLVVALGGRERAVGSRAGRLAVAAAAALVCAVGTVALVWAGYGFRYSAFNTAELPAGQFRGPDETAGGLAEIADRIPAPFPAVLAAVDRNRLLPEAFTYGTGFIFASRERAAFFRGEYSKTGWTGYFPYCFLVKTPWPLFGLLALAAVAVVRRGGADAPAGAAPQPPLWYRSAPLWVLFAAYWLVALNYPLNIGHRHILPTYPPLFVLAGAAARLVTRPMRPAGWAVVGLLAWSAVEVGTAFPHYLAYFNPALPPDAAYTALVESNVDWGQDLPALRDRLAARGAGPVFLDYFGSGRPAHYGIQSRPLPPPGAPDPAAWRPGLYCVSATNLQAVYDEPWRTWDGEKEARYRNRLDLLRRLAGKTDVTPRERDALADPQVARALVAETADLQWARLLIHLRHRRPDDSAGRSILIYDLKADELRDVLLGRPTAGPLAVNPK